MQPGVSRSMTEVLCQRFCYMMRNIDDMEQALPSRSLKCRLKLNETLDTKSRSFVILGSNSELASGARKLQTAS